MDFLFHHESLDSSTQVYSNVPEISYHNTVDFNLLVFSLFYPPLLVFLLNLLFFIGGSFCPNFSTYQPPPIACNNDPCFSFWNGFIRKVDWDFLIIIPLNEYANDSILINYVLRLLSNNQ